MAGVQFNPPPAEKTQPIADAIAKALAELPADKTGALVGVVNERGANAVIVARVADFWTVQAWVGKSWGGTTTYGANIKASW